MSSQRSKAAAKPKAGAPPAPEAKPTDLDSTPRGQSIPPARLDAPSVRAVGEVLRRGRMTAMQVRIAAGLPRRTVYSALSTLREEGLVEQRRSLQDSRQSYFWLVAAALPHAAEPLADSQKDVIASGAATDEPVTLAS